MNAILCPNSAEIDVIEVPDLQKQVDTAAGPRRILDRIKKPNPLACESEKTSMDEDLSQQEENLIKAAQQGDIAAFESLVAQHQRSVITTAYHMMHNETDADDIAQDVWIRVLYSLPRFRFQSRFSTWLYRITINQSLTALKKRNRRPGGTRRDIELDGVEGDYPLRDKKPGPLRILQGQEAAREFQKRLDALPKRQRLAVILVLIQGMSHREAGAIIGVKEKTVSWHLHKARKELFEKMKDVL